MAEKTRYSDEELQEFKEIIEEKLKVANDDYQQMRRTLMNADGNDVDDTSPPSRKKNSCHRQPACRNLYRD